MTNKFRNPESALQLTRDAKGLTGSPDRRLVFLLFILLRLISDRPQHALYEGGIPYLLGFNPVLPLLARLSAYSAFRDYCDIDYILRVVPLADGVIVL